MTYINNSALVSTSWLAQNIKNPNIRILDGSWHLPPTGRSGLKEFNLQHISGARFFDIDEISDKNSSLPHMLPSEEYFSSCVEGLGISNSNQVIIYDYEGLFSAPRVWWMFRAFGHKNVSILLGGLNSWIKENRPTSSELTKIEPGTFKAKLNKHSVASKLQLKENLKTKESLVIDARSSQRFNGSEPEFRPGVKSGHIPGSKNLPFDEIIDINTGSFVDNQSLQNTFDAIGATEDRPLITSCGSGITACVLALGLHLIGRDNHSIYDGSWTEWGSSDDTAIEV